MAKPLKILLALFGVMLLSLVAVAIALPLLFDPNDFRDKIAEAVRKETGREFAVGSIRLAVFPWLRVELRDVRLGNAEGFGAEPMLTVRRAEIGARLMPLLREERIEASALMLEGAQVNLAVDASGRNNWQDLLQPVDPDLPELRMPIAKRLQKLDIEGITVELLNLSYDDRQTGRQLQLADVRLKSGRLYQGKPFTVDGHFRAVASRPAVIAAADFSAEVTLAENGDVALASPRLKLDVTQTGESPLAAVMTLAGESLRYEAASQSLTSAPLTVELEDLAYDSGGRPLLKAKGRLLTTLAFNLASGDARLERLLLKLDAAQLGARPLSTVFELQSEELVYAKAAQTLAIAPLALQLESLVVGAADKPLLMAKGGIRTQLDADFGRRLHAFKNFDAELQIAGSALPVDKVQTLKLSASVLADLAAQQLRLSDVQLASFGLKASGRQWRISRLDGDIPMFDGDLAIASFEPRALLTALGIAIPHTADASTLKSASLSTQLSANARSASLKKLLLKLDDTTLRGELTLRDFASSAVRFALSADRLNADRYLPPAPAPGASVGANATPAAKAAANATELPIGLIDKLNAQGTLEVASMKLKNLKLANVRLKLDGAPGASHQQQLSASLYGGSAELAVTVAPGARHAVRLALGNINAGPLLKDFIDSDKLSGKGSMTLEVSSAGRTIGAVKRALDGKLAFNLVDGAVKGFNLGQVMRDGQALLAQQALAASAVQSTDFAELRGTGVISNGVLRSDDLSAKNPLLRLEGAGDIDLVKETINYLARPTLVNTAGGQGGKERTDLSGIVVPIRVSGDLYRPKVSIDWQAALQQQAVTRLREKLGVSEEVVREKREELRDRAKQQIGKELLKLFGSKPAKPAAEPPPAEAAPAP